MDYKESTLKMVRKPVYAGSVNEKDEKDIFYWAYQKSAKEKLCEGWRLHCMNHNISVNHKLNRNINKASKK